jgi:hypothetical protein
VTALWGVEAGRFAFYWADISAYLGYGPEVFVLTMGDTWPACLDHIASL